MTGNGIERDIGDIMRDEMVRKEEIARLLRDGPKTIPEIADRLEQPRHEVLIWAMAMWRYGDVKDTGQPDEEGYYRYQLARQE
jgi:hypothetical protein